MISTVRIVINDPKNMQKIKALSNKTYLKIHKNYRRPTDFKREIGPNTEKQCHVMAISFSSKGLRLSAKLKKLLGKDIM